MLTPFHFESPPRIPSHAGTGHCRGPVLWVAIQAQWSLSGNGNANDRPPMFSICQYVISSLWSDPTSVFGALCHSWRAALPKSPWHCSSSEPQRHDKETRNQPENNLAHQVWCWGYVWIVCCLMFSSSFGPWSCSSLRFYSSIGTSGWSWQRLGLWVCDPSSMLIEQTFPPF